MDTQKRKKMVVVVGPTATGKSDLAVYLARKFGGEVVSADSRQTYKGLDIGTGKVTKKEMRGVPHHLLDVASPKKVFTAAQYGKLAEKAIRKIWSKGKTPIICGGTGFYIRAVIDGLAIPEVSPDMKLRKKLEKKSAGELFGILKKLDPRRAGKIDAKNPRRLIRAIEIVKHLGKVPPLSLKPRSDCDILEIGIDLPDIKLKERIKKRLISRIKKGMVAEAKRFREAGLSLNRMESLGLEYRYLARYLSGKIGKEEMVEKLNNEIWRYAKRQRTWFKKDKRIRWFGPDETKKIERGAKNFLDIKGLAKRGEGVTEQK